MLSSKIFGEFQLDVQGFENDRTHIENNNNSETVSRRESIVIPAKRFSIDDFLQMPEEALEQMWCTVRSPLDLEEGQPLLYLKVRII